MTRAVSSKLLLAASLLVVLGAAAVSPAFAKKTDRIHVAGLLIVGEVKSLERGRLRISTDFMGTVEADWAQVTRVESEKLWFEIELRDGERYFGSIVESGEDGVLALEGTDALVRLPFTEIITIDQSKAGFWGKIDLDVALGYSFVQATETSQGSIDASASRRNRRFHSRLHWLSVLSDSKEESFLRNDGSYNALRNLPGRWTYDLEAGYQTNESLGLDERFLIRGSGLFRVLRTGIRELTLGAGLAQIKERFLDGQEGEDSTEGVFSLTYHAFHFDDPELQISASLDLFPSLTFSDRLRAEFRSDARRELGWDLFWSLSVYWTYDNRPVGDEVKSQDLTVTASLGWSP